MAQPTDIYDLLTPSGAPAPRIDEFGNVIGTAGFDPNSTAREQMRVAQDLAFKTTPPGAITIAPNSLADEQAQSIAAGWNQNTWTQTPGNLRQQLRLDELRTTAAARKFELERAQANAPIQDQLLQAQLAHQEAATAALGATKLRAIQKDATTMQHIAGFENYMQNAPQPGTPEYEAYVRSGIVKFPSILTTKYANEHVPNIAKEHDLAVKARGLQTKAEATDFKSTFGFPISALKESTIRVGNLDPTTNQLKQDNNGTHVAVTTPAGKTAVMTVQQYQAHGGAFSPETAAARAATAPTLANTPVQVKSVEEARALPSGTHFLDLNGVLRTRP